MIADGLTKALTNTSFDKARKQLGLVDISEALAEKARSETLQEMDLEEGLERLYNLPG